MTSIQSQLDQVLALFDLPDTPLNGVLVAEHCYAFMKEYGPAIRSAVGGEAVNVDAEARRLFELNSAGWAVKARWDELHPQTRELWHAHALKSLNPTATVDVGAFDRLREKWISTTNNTFILRSDRDYIEGYDEALKTCAKELAALIGEEA